jgi:predicted nucleotidyltransferase
MEIAMRLKQKILKKHKGQVIGIAIYGSVAKHEDRRYSDLEMFVVTRRKLKVREYRSVFRGMPVEVSYIPARDLLRRAKKVTPNWSIESDFYRSYLILYEENNWFKRLQRAVACQNQEDFRTAIKQYLVWLHELMGKIRNAYAYHNDSLFLWLTSFLGWESIMILGLINQRYYDSERFIFETVLTFPLLPKNYQHLLETVCHFSTIDREEIYHAASKLFSELTKLARRQGIILRQERLQY